MCENLRKHIDKKRWKKIYSKVRYMENSKKVTQEEYDTYTDYIEDCAELDLLLWKIFIKEPDYLNGSIERRLKRFKRMKKKNRLERYTMPIKNCRENI